MAEAGTRRQGFSSPRVGREGSGTVLFRQKRGGPKRRGHGEEYLCNTAGGALGVGWGWLSEPGRSEGTEIAVTPTGRSEGTVLVWHGCTLQKPAEPGGHGDVGVAGPHVGDAGREAYLWGRAALLLDRVSLGDLPSTAAGEPTERR